MHARVQPTFQAAALLRIFVEIIAEIRAGFFGVEQSHLDESNLPALLAVA